MMVAIQFLLVVLFELGDAGNGEWRLQASLQDGARGSAALLPCRVHLQAADGKPVEPPKLPFFYDDFVCDGEVALALGEGAYTYSFEQGPELTRARGGFSVKAGHTATTNVALRWLKDLAAERWYSGDPHSHRGDVEFFIDWIDERIRRQQASPHVHTDADREAAVAPQRAARQYFTALRDKAKL